MVRTRSAKEAQSRGSSREVEVEDSGRTGTRCGGAGSARLYNTRKATFRVASLSLTATTLGACAIAWSRACGDSLLPEHEAERGCEERDDETNAGVQLDPVPRRPSARRVRDVAMRTPLHGDRDPIAAPAAGNDGDGVWHVVVRVRRDRTRWLSPRIAQRRGLCQRARTGSTPRSVVHRPGQPARCESTAIALRGAAPHSVRRPVGTRGDGRAAMRADTPFNAQEPDRAEREVGAGSHVPVLCRRRGPGTQAGLDLRPRGGEHR